jgi:WD40 repeat protein
MRALSRAWLANIWLSAVVWLTPHILCYALQAEEISAGWSLLGEAPLEVFCVLGSTWLRSNGINRVEFSPDGTRLATTDEHEIKIWDTKTGGLITRHKRHEPRGTNQGGPTLMKFSSDGKSLFYGGNNRTVHFWNLETDAHTPKPFGTDRIQERDYLAAVSGDRRVVVFVGKDSQVLCDLEQGKQIAIIPKKQSGPLSLSVDGKLLAIANTDTQTKANAVYVWDTTSQSELYSIGPFSSQISVLLFSPDDKTLYVVDHAGEIQAWDLTTRQLLRTIHESGPYPRNLNAVLSSDGSRLAITDYPGPIDVVDTASGKVTLRLTRPKRGFARTIAISPDGRMLAVGGDQSVTEIWDLSTGAERLPHKGHTNGVYAMAAAPDGEHVAILDEFHLMLWKRTGELVAETDTGGFSFGNSDLAHLEFSRDGRFLLGQLASGRIGVWDARTLARLNYVSQPKEAPQLTVFSRDMTCRVGLLRGNAVTVKPGLVLPINVNDLARSRAAHPLYLTLFGHAAKVTCLAPSPNGVLLVSGGEDGQVIVWNTRLGRSETARFKGHEGPVTAAAISQDNTMIATGGKDRTVQLWEMPEGRQVHRWQLERLRPTALVFNSSATELAAGFDDGRVQVWDVKSRESQRILPAAGSPVTQLSWSADDRRLIVGGTDGLLRLVPAQKDAPIIDSRSHKAAITTINWLIDGKTMATGDASGHVFLWNIADDKPTRQVLGVRGTVAGIGLNRFAGNSDLNVQTADGNGYFAPVVGTSATIQAVLRQTSPVANDLERFTLSPDGQRLAASSSTSVVLWDGIYGKQIAELALPKGGNRVALSYDSKFLAANGKDLTIWRVGDSLPAVNLSGLETRFLRFSPVENTLITTSFRNNEVRLFNAESGNPLGRFTAPVSFISDFEITRDGTTLAILGGKQREKELCLVDVASGLELWSRSAWPNNASHFALLDDDRQAVVGDSSGVAVVWNLRPSDLPPKGALIPAEQIETWWRELADDDGQIVYRARWGLSEAGDQTLDFFQRHLKVIPNDGADLAVRVGQLIDQLAAGPEAARKASDQLLRLRPQADAALQRVIADKPASAIRTRIEMLLASNQLSCSSDELRLSRAVQVLGRIGSPRAHALLEQLAAGDPTHLQTQAAKRALIYLHNRSTPGAVRP